MVLEEGALTCLAEQSSPTEPRAVSTGGLRMGDIREPKKVHHVAPRYPEAARQARVQGLVILEAEIGTTGCVHRLRVLRGVPVLDWEAIRAVSQWRYTPTLLDGQPVPVLMTVTINFKFS